MELLEVVDGRCVLSPKLLEVGDLRDSVQDPGECTSEKRSWFGILDVFVGCFDWWELGCLRDQS
jgi:hypothetical protein